MSVPSASTDANQPTHLWDFIGSLFANDPIPITSDPPWFEPGNVYEVDDAIYMHFLEVLPPRWIHGNWFAFGGSGGPFRLFCQFKDVYLGRELTDAETDLFCKLSHVSLYG